MLDEKDIALIQKMITDSEERVTKRTEATITDSEERITKRTVALMDMEFAPKFNLLADNIAIIMEKLGVEPRVAKLEEEMSAVKAAVRTNHADIEKLRKAM